MKRSDYETNNRHTNIDATIGKAKIVSNQMGYVFQDEHLINGFDAGKFISLV